MKILYLCSEFPLVSETFIIHEISSMISQGADVRILSLRRPSEEKYSALPTELGFFDRIFFRPPLQTIASGQTLKTLKLAIPYFLRGNIKAFVRLFTNKTSSGEYARSVLLETATAMQWADWKPDIIHCHFGPMGRFAAMLKHYHLIDAKITTTFHGYDVSRTLKNTEDDYYKNLFLIGDLFFSVNTDYLAKIRQLGAPVEKSKLFHMGVDCSSFKYMPRTMPTDRAVRFICVGRLTEKKGHSVMIRAFAEFRAMLPSQDAYLDIIGDGELRAECEELVKDLGLSAHITFHGAVQHLVVKEMLSRADIFLLHSITANNGDKEGIPVVLMEAMAQGLPVISTRHSGIPDLIDHEISGLLSEEQDMKGFANLMARLVQHPQLWLPMMAAAREKVEREFDQASLSKDLYYYFKSLL